MYLYVSKREHSFKISLQYTARSINFLMYKELKIHRRELRAPRLQHTITNLAPWKKKYVLTSSELGLPH
jgi:hypothetical protein